jgi:anti-sigma B factor antagonist
MSLAEEFGVREQTEFTIRTSGGPGRHVIQPYGQLDLVTRDQLHAVLMAAFESSTKTVVLDLSRLDFMDSSGIHLIALATRTAAERRREFFLVRGPTHIQRLFDLAGITNRLPFVD